MMFQYENEANKVMEALKKRLAKFDLELAEDKTRILPIGRFKGTKENFDFLGITIQYEMCYTNILQVLDLSGIPLRSEDRGWDVPIVIGGGPCTYNPEPIAPFFDLFYIQLHEMLLTQ